MDAGNRWARRRIVKANARQASDIGSCGVPNPFFLWLAKFRFGGRVKSSRDQLDLCAARGIVLPSAAAIADISGFMK
jgi:hypothetical protein